MKGLRWGLAPRNPQAWGAPRNWALRLNGTEVAYVCRLGDDGEFYWFVLDRRPEAANPAKRIEGRNTARTPEPTVEAAKESCKRYVVAELKRLGVL